MKWRVLMARKLLNYMGLLIAVGLWGTTFIISRALLDKINVFALICLRMVIGCFSLLLSLIIAGKKSKLVKMFSRYKKKLIFLGIFAMATPYLIQYAGLPLTTTINQSILLQFQVFFVILFDLIVYKKKPTVVVIVGGIIGFLGVILINLNENFGISYDTIWGELLTILTCFFYGIATSFSKPICEKEENDPIVFNTILLCIASIVIFPFAITVPGGFTNISMLDWFDWLGLLYLGAMCTGVTFVLWFFALRDIESPKVAVFVYLEPIFAIILSLMFLLEKFTVFTLIGMIFCFSGVFIAQLEFKKKSRKKNIDSLPGGAIIHEY